MPRKTIDLTLPFIIQKLPIETLKLHQNSFVLVESKWLDDDSFNIDKLTKVFSSVYKYAKESHMPQAEQYKISHVLTELASGKVVSNGFLLFRIKHEALKCPLCGCSVLDEGLMAVSRRDNQTKICNDCGMKEAMEDFYGFRE